MSESTASASGELSPEGVHGSVELSSTTVYVRQWGSDGDPAVLFVHQLGIAGSSLHLAEVGSLLASSYALRVVAPDLPGFGGSPPWAPERYSPPALAELLLELLDRLQIPSAAVVGLSWGATIGCHVAALSPERVSALVLLGAGHVDAADQPGFDRDASLEDRVRAAARQLDGFRFRRLADALDHVSDDYPAWTPDLERSWTSALRLAGGRVRPRLRPEVYGGAVHGLAAAPPSQAWPAIASSGVPVLLVTADEPAAIRELQAAARARFAAAVPQADVIVARGQRHDLVAGLGPQLASYVGDWLTERLP